MDTTKKTSKPGYEIAEADVQIDTSQKLGAGGYGAVFKGMWQGTEVALKVLLSRMEGDMEAEFRREIETMLKLQGCPQLVRLYGAVMDGHTQVMVMELMPRGNLHSLLRKEKDLDWDTKYRIALDVAYGIKYLHDRNILHRDLNSMNVLFNKEGRAQIGDFGLAEVKSAMARDGSGVGTLLWMAPELLGRKATFSNASDIYALGMVLYEMLTHKTPFETELQRRHPSIMMPYIIDGERPKLIETGPQDYKALIESCWHQVAGSRPMASDLIARLEPLWQLEQASPNHTPNMFKPKASKPELDQKLVNRFVQHVAYGEQDEAEEMLKREPKLALGNGNCKDHAGREFKGITGFQYALWALDWHMWEMIRGYLDRVDPQSAAIQCQAQESLTSAQGHGAHFSFEPLVNAYKTYMDHYDGFCAASNWKGLKQLWVHGVGGAQRDVVAHVAQEYCHPGRSFYLVPDFTAKPFPRQLIGEEGDWWNARVDGKILGGTPGRVSESSMSGFSWIRHGLLYAGAATAIVASPTLCVPRPAPVTDGISIASLCEIRTLQLGMIRLELSTSVPYHYGGAWGSLALG